jgi:hypothetical protein
MRWPGRQTWTLLGVFVVVALLWSTPVLLPLKILVVFFHEASHGLSCMATGGSVDKLVFGADQGGLAFTQGGSRFVIVNAGYLGSFVWGSALILGSAWTRRDHYITGALGVCLGLLSVLYVRNLFGLFFGLAAAGGLIVAARRLSDQANDFLLKVIGVTSCGYAILDIWDDVMARSCCMSDASALARMTFIPAKVWGAVWIALTLVGMYYTLEWAAKADKRR